MVRKIISILTVIAGIMALLLMFFVNGSGFLDLSVLFKSVLAAISLLLLIGGVLIWRYKSQAPGKIKAALVIAAVVIVFSTLYASIYDFDGPARELSMEEVLENEANITGIVQEVAETYIIITCEPTPQIATTDYRISLDVDMEGSMMHFDVGDEVIVYYDGNIAETDPLEINKVYAIILKTPANRE